jgi:hypothetical protein
VSPLFKGGQNVNFKDGGVQPAHGQLFLTSTGRLQPIRGMQSTLIAGEPTLFFGDLNRLYEFSGDSISELGSGYTGLEDASSGSRATLWSLAPWGEWMLATNGNGAIQISKSAGSFSDLSGSPPSDTELLVTDSPFVLAMNTANGGNAIEWCDEDDVETWTPAVDNSAGSLFPRELSSDIIAALSFRGRPIFLTLNELGVVNYVGPPFIYGVEVQLQGIGVVGKHAVTVAGNALYGFGPRGIWRSDGRSFEYMDAPQLHEYVYDDFNDRQRSKVVAWFNPFDAMVVFHYPSRNSQENDRGVAFDTRNGVWTIYSFGRSAVDRGQAFENAVIGGTEGQILYTDVETATFGAQIGRLVNDESYSVKVGYGVGGYGQFGYGGSYAGD